MSAVSRGAQRHVGETTEALEKCLQAVRDLAAQRFRRSTVTVEIALAHLTDNWCRLRDHRELLTMAQSARGYLRGRTTSYPGKYATGARSILDDAAAEGLVVGTRDMYWPAGQ